MSQNVTLHARGLYTFPNYLGEIPDGALSQADNVVIDRDGVVESRRGFPIYGTGMSTSSTTAKQLMTYKGRILRHWLTTVDYDSDAAGNFSVLSSSISEPTSGTRIKYLESNGNFYFTSSSGIMKISASSASGIGAAGITAAGGIKALDGVGTLNSQTGFFTQDSAVAYRIVWGIKDNNNNVILGFPSPLIVVENPLTDLIINDFNTLVGNLTQVAEADATQALQDTTYNQMKISGNSSPQILYNSLLVLASGSNNKLDTDLSLTGMSTTTTAGSTTATVTSNQNVNPGMILSGNANLALSTSVSMTTYASSNAASVPNTSGLASGMLLSGNPNISSGSTISSVSPGVVINPAIGLDYVTSGTADYFDILSGTSGIVYRFWFSVGSSTAPSGAGVTLIPVTILTTDTAAQVTTKLNTAFVTSAGVFTTEANNITLTVTGASVGSPISHVANANFTMAVTNLLLSALASTSATSSTTVSSSSISLTTSTGSTTASTSDTTSLSVGILLSGNSNLASGTTIAAIVDGTTITLSSAATASGTALTGVNNTSVVAVSDDGVTITLSAPASSSGTASTDFVSTTFQNIAVPTAPNTPATTIELDNIQTYFDNIVNALNTVRGISSTGRAAIGGSFFNSTQSATVNLTFTIPTSITTAYFYQIYRSALATSTGAISLSDVSPSDELQLVFEDNPSSDELVAKSITYHDIVPETFREGGANLYTNANSGEGILQANEVPPLAQDIALYKGCTFYANTKTKHSLQIDMLTGIGLPGETFTITQGSTVNTYTFAENTNQVTHIQAIAGNLFTSSGTADYFDISLPNGGTKYRVWFSVGTATAPSSTNVTLVECAILNADSSAEVAGKIRTAINSLTGLFATLSSSLVTVTNDDTGPTTAPVSHVADNTFTITVATAGNGENAATKTIGVSNAATPGQVIDETARSLCRVVNKNASEIVYAYYISGTNDVPGQMNFEARVLGSNPFHLTSSIGANFNPTLPSSGNSVISDNQIVPNRVYYSKLQQPEAVPTVNYQDVGPQDKAILRILPLRDSVFILSEDGVYRLAGNDPSTFQITLFDNTTRITAADSAVVLNNQIFVMSDQGVTSISDTGVSVLSRPIENQIIPVSQYTNFSTATFGVSYSTDRAYLLWTVTNSNDTVATQCFRFNTFTNTWSRWPISKTCGVVPPETNVLYLGAGDTNFIEKERKSFTRLDHADRQYDLSVSSVSGTTATLVSLGLTTVGDVLVQTQYLTISQFNRLLNKLDADNGVAQKNFVSTLSVSAGVDIRTALTALAAKLDTDTGLNDPTYSSAISGFSTSFVDCQSAFNVIITKLNSSIHASFKNYTHSTGVVEWEVPVLSTGKQSTLTMQYAAPLIKGIIVMYKHITSQFTWAPHAFGDPSMLKHTSEATIIFENVGFSQATSGFASDLSTGYQSIPIVGEGTGIWGSFNWGQVIWGGEGSSRPFRTLVPLNKQRSRYLSCQFTHSSAFEQYSIFGLSYTFNPISNKAYR